MSEPSSLRVPSYRRHKPTGQAVVTINGLRRNRKSKRDSHPFYARTLQIKGSGRDRVLHVLKTSDGSVPLFSRQIAEKIGMDRSNVTKILRREIDAGTVSYSR